MLSRGRKQGFRCQLCSSAQRLPAISKPSPSLCSEARFAPSPPGRPLPVCWHLGPRLPQLGLAPPASLHQKVLREPEGGCCPPSPNSASRERVLASPGYRVHPGSTGAFYPGLFPLSLPALPLQRNPRAWCPHPASWLDLRTPLASAAEPPSSERNQSPSGFNFWDS